MTIASRKRVSNIIKSLDPETYKILRFATYVSIILVVGMTSAVFAEKIHKTPYIRDTSSPNQSPQSDYFKNPFGIPLFNGFFALCYGFFMYEIANHNSEYRQQNNNNAQKQYIKLSIVDMGIHLLLWVVVILASFTSVNLINCCNLLSVVIFGVFFSNASSNYKIEKRQIGVALIICVGIFIFNFFGVQQKNTANQPLTVWSGLLMLFVLLLQGYRPELASQIRQQYSPPPSFLYYQVTKYSFLFLVILSIITMKGWDLLVFLWEHDRLALDLMLVAILDLIAAIFIYRIVVLHQQHIMPMISTVRKLCTSVFNIYYFDHQIMGMQYVGLALVAVTILVQMYIRYRSNSEKFNHVQTQDQPYLG